MEIANGFVKAEDGSWININVITGFRVFSEGQDKGYSILACLSGIGLNGYRLIQSGFKTEQDAQVELNMYVRRL